MVHDDEVGTSIEVVGVGASAGGLKALTSMLGGFSGDGPAIVIVTHLAPDQQTYLHDILSRRSPVPIKLAEDQEVIERGRGYVIPPGRSMIVSRGRLLLGDRDPDESPNLPVDVFFRSLAADYGDRAAAVVLSGTGRDGSRGIQEVHEVGGLVVVQDPDSAEFASMPEASLATGLVDAVVPPEQIADEIEKHASLDETGDSVRETRAVSEVLDRVHRQSGIDFRQYKRTTVLRRLKRRVALLELPDVAAYRDRLATDLVEVDALYQDLLIGVTRFFRDAEAFDVLRTRLRKLVIERAGDSPPLRIWVPGCATGEEAYTIAAMLCDIFRELERSPDFRVFATDIHPSSLETASQARYGAADLEEIPERLRDRWFETTADGIRVAPEVRDQVVFARHDLIRDPPFTRVDLVSCRNLLIYFRPETQRRVMTLFHFALRTEGLLFLGPSETPGRLADEFETIDRRWRLYRKKRDVRLHPDFRVHGAAPPPPRRRVQNPGDLALRALVDTYAPPTVLVDHNGDVVHSYAGGSRFLRPADGPVTSRLLDQLSGELKNAVSAALQASARNGNTSWYRGIRTRLDGEDVLVDVQAAPVLREGAGTMVHIRLRDERPAEQQGEDAEPLDLAAERVHVLEGELRETQQNLQTALEEMETSNEELQATNEELIASNEELQSTNEELNSVNEELYTVNAEHNEKIDELQRLSRDMDYVLSASDVHVLFLDAKLRIRKFTSGLQRLLGLVDHDTGRDIDLFASQLNGAPWLDALSTVMESGRRVTFEVIGRDGKLYLLRVAPYHTPRGIEGVVLLLSDLSEVRELESQRERMAAIIEQSPDLVIGCRPSGVVTDLNASVRALLQGVDVAHIDELLPEPAVLYREAIPHAIEHGTWHGELVIEVGETRIETSAVVVAGVEVPGHDRILSVICRDIGPLKQAQREREEIDRRKDRFLSSLSHELRNPIAALKHAVALLGPDRPERLAEVRAMCDRQVETLRRLVDDLLDHSRIATGGIRLEKRPIDLRDVVRSSVETLSLLTASRRLEVHGDLDSALPVAGDAARLQQVVVNLLTNADRYGLDRPIRVTVSRNDGQVELQVRDQGCGLTPEHLERVFEPFFRVDDEDRQGGVGIGLTLARRIAELHGGQLLGSSEGLGTGCTFTLVLPLAEAAGVATDQVSEEPTEEAGPLEVLLVDDNVDSTVALQMLLESEGHTVRVAHTLADGIEAVRSEPPDVVVCDIGLPDGSGEQLASTFAGQPDAPRLIALSGWGQHSDVQRSLAAGFQVHLTKPVDLDELLGSLRV